MWSFEDDQADVSWRDDPAAALHALLHRRRASVAPGSLLVYQAMLASAVKFMAQHRTGLTTCGTDLVAAWLETVSDSPRTRIRYGTLLSWVFKDMVKRGERQDDPATSVLEGLREPKRALPLALQPRQESQFREAVARAARRGGWRALRDRAILLVLLDAGVKVQELRDLRTSDYFPDADLPRLKVLGRKEERWAPIAAEGVNALEDWLRIRNSCGLPESPWMFPSDRAPSPLHSASIYRIVDSTFGLAGIELKHQGAEVLRATFAARQFRSGKTLNFVQTCLGHQWPDSTEPLRRAALGERPA